MQLKLHVVSRDIKSCPSSSAMCSKRSSGIFCIYCNKIPRKVKTVVGLAPSGKDKLVISLHFLGEHQSYWCACCRWEWAKESFPLCFQWCLVMPTACIGWGTRKADSWAPIGNPQPMPSSMNLYSWYRWCARCSFHALWTSGIETAEALWMADATVQEGTCTYIFIMDGDMTNIPSF